MASGSVVEQGVWLLRFSRWEFTVGFEPSPVPVVGGWWSSSKRRKLFCPAHASSRVPSHGEVLIREQIALSCLLEHGCEKSVSDVALQADAADSS